MYNTPYLGSLGMSLVCGKLRHSSPLIKLELKTHPKLKVIIKLSCHLIEYALVLPLSVTIIALLFLG